MKNKEANSQSWRLKALVAALVGVGVAFMSRLPQLIPGQEAIPWYHSGFFWAGMSIVIIALLLLVPPSWWKWLGRFLANVPRNLQTIWWLQSVLRFNKDNIYKAVKCRFVTSRPAWDFLGLEASPHDPYFEIKLELTNTSIFDIRVLGIDGYIYIDGSECQDPARINYQPLIRQGDVVDVIITQPIRGELMLKRIKDAYKKERLKFDLGKMHLNLETTTKGYEAKKIPISFGLYVGAPGEEKFQNQQ